MLRRWTRSPWWTVDSTDSPVIAVMPADHPPKVGGLFDRVTTHCPFFGARHSTWCSLFIPHHRFHGNDAVCSTDRTPSPPHRRHTTSAGKRRFLPFDAKLFPSHHFFLRCHIHVLIVALRVNAICGPCCATPWTWPVNWVMMCARAALCRLGNAWTAMEWWCAPQRSDRRDAVRRREEHYYPPFSLPPSHLILTRKHSPVRADTRTHLFNFPNSLCAIRFSLHATCACCTISPFSPSWLWLLQAFICLLLWFEASALNTSKTYLELFIRIITYSLLSCSVIAGFHHILSVQIPPWWQHPASLSE